MNEDEKQVTDEKYRGMKTIYTICKRENDPEKSYWVRIGTAQRTRGQYAGRTAPPSSAVPPDGVIAEVAASADQLDELATSVRAGHTRYCQITFTPTGSGERIAVELQMKPHDET